MQILRPFSILILAMICFSACRKEVDGPPSAGPTGGEHSVFGNSITVSVGGQVMDEMGQPVSGAVVSAGSSTHQTTTNEHGAFLLQDIPGYRDHAYVKVYKSGYFHGSRAFVPVDGINQVRIQLVAKAFAGIVPGSAGGSVTLEGVQIEFPANGFTRDGVAYSGNVHVRLNHLDPSGSELFDQMPGALLGTIGNEPRILRSFGMVAVELTDDGSNAIQLATPATISFPIPSSMAGEADPTIDLWHFDETTGHWVKEGEATLQGSNYVAQVDHFSWWNCDVPANFVQMTGKLLHQSSGLPIAGAQVRVQPEGFSIGITNTSSTGHFGGLVPRDMVMNIEILMGCGQGSMQTIHTTIVEPYTDAFDLQLEVSTSITSILTHLHGAVTDCDGLPVDAGYVMADQVIHWLSSGNFGLFTCEGSVSIQAVDQGTFVIGETVNVSLAGGSVELDLEVCGEAVTSGSATDIDGNVYPTLLIGTQEWLAVNLRTSRFSNGDNIPEITANSSWATATSPAWCNFSNASVTEEALGKLYNSYVIRDPRNVCPIGFHVPSHMDWRQLEQALGMPEDQLDLIWTVRGIEQNVGGQLKATVGWAAPNTGANNASNFTAVATGYRGPNGSFGQVEQLTGLASSDALSGDSISLRTLSYSDQGVYVLIASPKDGISIRCVRD